MCTVPALCVGDDAVLPCPSTEQDEGLDVLASVISRQRQMAGAIGAEIEEQSGECCCFLVVVAVVYVVVLGVLLMLYIVSCDRLFKRHAYCQL